MRLGKVVLALGVAALMCAPALAQQGRRGGGGFGGGASLSMLVQNKSVQDELKLDKDQVTKAEEAIKKVQEDLKDDYAKLRGGRRGGGGTNVSDEERTAARKKVSAAEEKALADTLKPDQMKRLQQIHRQQEGVRVFQDEDVQQALKLTAEQKEKIKTINDDLAKERRELFQQGGGGGRRGGNPETINKLQALNKDAMTSAQKVLNDDQKKTFKELTGEPFEIKFDRGGRQGGKPRTDF
ncbi:MAG TPA: hypothetical protein VFA26_03730 [Gemmataceae bacterium]|nr:hypothetical protein [Gemmataceae bacterium]